MSKTDKIMCAAAVVSAVILVLIFLFVLNMNSDKNQSWSSADFFSMNTSMRITVPEKYESVLAEAEAAVKHCESLWSVRNEKSEIYAINHSQGNQLKVSPETAGILSASVEMAARTGGRFNPALYAVTQAWGFTTDSHQIPDESSIKRLLTRADWTQIKIDGDTVQIPENMQVDLGGIGKGYTSDIVVSLLSKKGVPAALIDLGGNIHACGKKSRTEDWRIGIRNPFAEDSLLFVDVADKAVVTSGLYERFFVGSDDKIYGHIIDPETGRPVENELLSVTVIGGKGYECDALATALFVMGAESACEYWESDKGFDMILVTSDGKIMITPSIQKCSFVNELYASVAETVIIGQ